MTARLRFGISEAQAATEDWGFNCGPAALCAVLGKTPSEIRPFLREFERKGYTNPTLMSSILHDLRVPFHRIFEQPGQVRRWGFQTPKYPNPLGLVRIQWDGPWCQPHVPTRACYRHTHWVGFRQEEGEQMAFDVNALSVGGWISWMEWREEIAPWLLTRCEPKATGQFWPTHCWEMRQVY